MKIKTPVAALLAALLLSAAAPTAGDPPTAARLRGHVEFLASDALEGREAGKRGHQVAAQYVASEFRKLGLEPAGDLQGYFQDVPIRRALHEGNPRVALIRPGGREEWASGRDFGIRPSLTVKARRVEAPLLFVGHGLREPRLGIDDYAGLDPRGAIVVVLDGVPPGIRSDVAAHLQSRKDEVAAAMGAAGILRLPDPEARGGAMDALDRNARPLLSWADRDGRAGDAGAIGIDMAVAQARAAALFEGAPQDWKAVRKAARKGPVRGFALKPRIAVTSDSRWEDLSSPNVVARLPGSDPALAGESIVLMAHLDHVGIDDDQNGPPGRDRIRNGALDNAIGVATMIEAARRFAASPARPRRSILFIASTAEEKGLLGAEYFAARPASAGRPVALVNLDMPLLLYDFTDVIAFGAEHSTIRDAVAGAARSMGVALSADPMPEENLFTRSDHYPFVLRGVPSIFLMTGHANGGKAAWDAFLTGDYHGPGDDLGQPIDWLAGARFAELNYRIALTLADAATAPRWAADSYFAPAAAQGARP